MNQNLVHHFSMGIVGICVFLVALENFLSEGISFAPFLMAFGGFGVFFVSFYSLSEGKTLEFDDKGWVVWLSVITAFLSLAGALLIFL